MTPENVQTGARWTAVVLCSLLLAAFVWDVFVAHKWGRESTISHVFHEWLRDEPLVVLLLAILLWHFIWPLH